MQFTCNQNRNSGQQYWIGECRTTSGKLIMAEGRTEQECRAALTNQLNRYLHATACKAA